MIIKNNKGFTLIEMLLYIVIAGGLLFSITIFLSLLIQSRVKNRTISAVEQQGVQVMQIINQAVRNAKIVSAPIPGSSSAVLDITDYSGNQTIFRITSNTIVMTEAGKIFNLLPANIAVATMTFSNLSSGDKASVRTQLDLNWINGTGRNEYDYTQTFYETADIR